MAAPDLSGSGLGMMHINSQSLLPKMGEFELMLNSVKPDIVCLTETWLSDSIPDGVISCPDYSVIRHDRQQNRRGGGIACYLHGKLLNEGSIDERRDLWISNSHIELQIFELKIRNIKKMILVNAYRPPSGKAEMFVDSLTDTLSSIVDLHEFDIFVLGDFNLPYNLKNCASYKKLKSFESKFGLRQLISKPTRFSAQTANILDLVFTNSGHILIADTWETSFSDHQPVYVIRKKCRTKTPRTNFCCRSFRNYTKADFQRDLLNHDWTTFFQVLCPEMAWLMMYNVISKYADEHCPYKEYVSKKELPKWLNNEILEFLKERDYRYRIAKRTMDPQDWAELRKLRNKCTRIISKAKNDYVLAKLDEHAGDVKKFWHVINSVFTGTTQSRTTVQIRDPDTNTDVPDDQCPNYMNNHLVGAGPKLANNLPHVPFHLTFQKFLTRLKFKRISVEETIKQIDSISVTKSSAIDGLSSRVLKDAFDCLPIHLTYIFNLSIDTGTFLLRTPSSE